MMPMVLVKERPGGNHQKKRRKRQDEPNWRRLTVTTMTVVCMLVFCVTRSCMFCIVMCVVHCRVGWLG